MGVGAEAFLSGSAGVGPGTAARGRQAGPAGCWQKLSSTAQSRTLPGPGGESRAAEIKPPLPLAISCHTHLSFCLPVPVLPGTSLPRLPPAPGPPSPRESYWRRNQGRTSRLKWVGAPVSPDVPLPCSWALCFAEVGGPAVFSGGGSHNLGVLEEEGLEWRGPGDP